MQKTNIRSGMTKSWNKGLQDGTLPELYTAKYSVLCKLNLNPPKNNEIKQ